MRTNLQQRIVRLALVALIANGAGLHTIVSAHDFPSPMATYSHISDCFGSRLNCDPQPPALRQSDAVEPAPAWKSSTAAFLDAAERAVRLYPPLKLSFDALAASRRTALGQDYAQVCAAFPDEGNPQAPPPEKLRAAGLFTAPARAKQAFIEDYMPYDFCVRDWRFGQYSYRGLSRIAHLDLDADAMGDDAQLAEAILVAPVEPGAAVELLKESLVRLDDVRRDLEAELLQVGIVRSVARVGSRLNARAGTLLTDALISWTEHLAAVPSSTQLAIHPYFTEPLYVLHDQDGHQFLLPVDGARPEAAKDAVEPASELARGLGERILGLASQQLEILGTQCLQLSDVLSSIANSSVARRESGSLR